MINFITGKSWPHVFFHLNSFILKHLLPEYLVLITELATDDSKKCAYFVNIKTSPFQELIISFSKQSSVTTKKTVSLNCQYQLPFIEYKLCLQTLSSIVIVRNSSQHLEIEVLWMPTLQTMEKKWNQVTLRDPS